MINGFGICINFFSVKSHEESHGFYYHVCSNPKHTCCVDLIHGYSALMYPFLLSFEASLLPLFSCRSKSLLPFLQENSSCKIIPFTQKWFPAFIFGKPKAVSSVKDLDWVSFGERALQYSGLFLTHHYNNQSTQHDEYVQGSSGSLLCGLLLNGWP